MTQSYLTYKTFGKIVDFGILRVPAGEILHERHPYGRLVPASIRHSNGQ